MFGSTAAPTPPPPALPDPLPSSPTYAANTPKPTGNTNQYGSFGKTIMTSPQGDLTPTNTSKKSLLGV